MQTQNQTTETQEVRYQDLPCNNRQKLRAGPKSEKPEHGLPTKKRHLLKAIKKQVEYELMAEKFKEHLEKIQS